MAKKAPAKKAVKKAVKAAKARKAASPRPKVEAAVKARPRKAAPAKTAPLEAGATPKADRKARSKPALTKPQLREFRELLLDKRRSLIGDMNGIAAEALRHSRGEGGDLSNMPTHPADLGSDNYEQEFTLGLLESERVLLTEINEALMRITDGSYGTCQGTGEAIGIPRLRAKPWAKYSIEYARMIEKGLVRPGDHLEDGNGHDDPYYDNADDDDVDDGVRDDSDD